MRIFTLIILFVLSWVTCVGQVEYDGLSFLSHTVNQEKRTGVILAPDTPFNFDKEGFEIDFQIKLREEQQSFGYIFRMIADNSSSFDFVSNLVEHKFSFILSNHLGQKIDNETIIDPGLLVANKWISVRIRFAEKSVKINLDGQEWRLDKGFERYENIQFYFGSNTSKYFHTSDVPPFTLKDIKIKEKGKLIRFWKFQKHHDSLVYDEIAGAMAAVKNPLWEIDKHVNWTKASTFRFKEQPQVAFDKKSGRLFMVTAKSVFTYDIPSDKYGEKTVLEGNPYKGVSRQIIYDPSTNSLLSYTVQSSLLSSYSFAENKWSMAPTLEADSRQHHNAIIDTANNKLLVFMGYGYHTYQNTIAKLDLGTTAGAWNEQSIKPAIDPRYLSALGQLDKKNVLLLGGYGSKSGKQEEFPRNYYDLYKIDVERGKSIKLWEFTNDRGPYVFSNSMYIDSTKNRLYVLAYDNFNSQSKILLLSFDIHTKKPEYTIYGASLPYHFLDIKSYCDLLFDSSTKSFYGLVSYESQQGDYVVDLYKIAYPPMLPSEVDQRVTKSNNRQILYISIAIILVVTLVGCGYGYVVFRRKEKKNAWVGEESENLIEDKEMAPNQAEYKLQAYLFGSFRLIGKHGIDRANEFTPIQKQIFLFLLINKIKNKSAVPSQVLDNTFWLGMSHEKALNNRGVNMRKLRVLLASIGEIEVLHKNGLWELIFHEGFSCDLDSVDKLLNKKSGGNNVLDATALKKLIKLAKDPILFGIEYAWLDQYKSDFTSELIKQLLAALTNSSAQLDDMFKLQLADVILVHDCLEENAVTYKCNLLYKIGHKGQSKQAFDKYCLAYRSMLEDEPLLDYNKIILLQI